MAVHDDRLRRIAFVEDDNACEPGDVAEFGLQFLTNFQVASGERLAVVLRDANEAGVAERAPGGPSRG